MQGVRIVIDSGLMREPKFSPRTGMSRLETVSVSRASADQRRGRAGREAPGICYRLWTEEEDRQLVPFGRPEMLEADLSGLALELAAWGVQDPQELEWLDVPPGPAFCQATDLLRQLGALDQDGRLTTHGQRLAEAGLHPRLGGMILKAKDKGTVLKLACWLLYCRNATCCARRRDGLKPIFACVWRRCVLAGWPDTVLIREEARVFWPNSALSVPVRVAAVQTAKIRPDASGLLLAFAYPDRVAKQRSTGKFLLRNGRGAALAELQPLSGAPYIVAAELDDQGTESRIQLAAAISLEEIQASLGAEIESESAVEWSRDEQAVRARSRLRLGALVLEERQLSKPDPGHIAQALGEGIREQGLAILPWTKPLRQLQQRMVFMHSQDTRWPGADDVALLDSLSDWLVPHLYGMRSLQDLKRVNLKQALESMLTWERQRQLEQEAPTHIAVPSGSRIAVDYSEPSSPVLAVRLQELFGLLDTPRIGTQKSRSRCICFLRRGGRCR